MAFWRQAPERENPRNGTAPTRNNYPRTAALYAPEKLPPSMDNPGSTLPSDGFRARPSFLFTQPSFGEHDGLDGALMKVAQADLTDAHANPFPATGNYDQPGAWHSILPLIRLQPTTSAHPGLASATGAGPAMFYAPPPPYAAQTVPILATGL